MKRIPFIGLSLFLLGLPFLQGCKKEIKASITDPDGNIAISKLVPLSITPAVENGMLSFTDMTQFNNYLTYLDTIIRPDTTNPNDTLLSDTKLDNIESQFAYNSLRKKVNQDFAQTAEAGFTTLENHPRPDWFIDRSVLSVYNVDRCVKVGGKINFWYSKDIGIYIEDGSLTSLAKAKALPAGLTLNQVCSRMRFTTGIKVYDMTRFPATYDVTNYFKINADTNWRTDFTVLPRVDCNNNNRTFSLAGIGIEAQGVNAFDLIAGIRNKLDIQVDWGDGNTDYYPSQVAVNSGGAIEWPMLHNAHTYANAGTYLIKIKVRMSYHTTWVAEAQSTLEIDPYMCGAWGRKWSGQYAGYYSDVAVEGEIETFQSFWNQVTFCATSRGYKFQNSKYKHKKVDRLVVQMYFNLFSDCSNSGTYMWGAEWPYNDKTTCTSVRCGKSILVGYDIVVSNHRTYKGTDNWANLDMNMKRCE